MPPDIGKVPSSNEQTLQWEDTSPKCRLIMHEERIRPNYDKS
jgi:hypothetical protein